MADYSSIGEPEDYGSFVMPFGKYAGQTLDDIASTNSGLLYLDWAAGELECLTGDIIREYVSDEGVQRDINEAIDESREWHEE